MLMEYLPAELKVAEGRNVLLKCLAEGAPQPVITWRKGSEVIFVSTDRFTFHPNGSLEIKVGSAICYMAYNTSLIISLCLWLGLSWLNHVFFCIVPSLWNELLPSLCNSDWKSCYIFHWLYSLFRVLKLAWIAWRIKSMHRANWTCALFSECFGGR